MPMSLSSRGWSPWTPGSTIEHTYYAERGSEGLSANVPSRLAGSHQLTAAEAVAFTTRKFLAGVDHWDPIPNVAVAVATQAGRPGAGEGTMKAGRRQSARLSRESHMIGDLALSARRLRFSE
jgi:Pectinesterase